MEKIRVIITNSQKAVKVPTGVRMLIRRCCHAVLRMEKFEDSAEISVTFVDNEQIRELNAQYRNKDAATDVLSFPMGENGVYDINHDTGAKILGDIVLSVEMAMAQATSALTPIMVHISRHGFFAQIKVLHITEVVHNLAQALKAHSATRLWRKRLNR